MAGENFMVQLQMDTDPDVDLQEYRRYTGALHHCNITEYGGCSGCGVIPIAPIIDRIPPVLFNIGLSPKKASQRERSRLPLKKRFSSTRKTPVDGAVCCDGPFTISKPSGLVQSSLPLRKRVNARRQLISLTPSYKDNSPSCPLLIPATVLNIQDEPLDLSVRSRKRHREEENPGYEKRPKLSLEHQTDDWDWKWDDGCQTEIVVNVSKNIEADDDDNEYDKYYTAGDADGDQNPPQMAAPHGDDDDSDVDSISDELVFSWEELPPVISANPRTAVFQPVQFSELLSYESMQEVVRPVPRRFQDGFMAYTDYTPVKSEPALVKPTPVKKTLSPTAFVPPRFAIVDRQNGAAVAPDNRTVTSSEQSSLSASRASPSPAPTGFGTSRFATVVRQTGAAVAPDNKIVTSPGQSSLSASPASPSPAPTGFGTSRFAIVDRQSGAAVAPDNRTVTSPEQSSLSASPASPSPSPTGIGISRFAIVDRKTGAAIAPDNRTSSLSVSSSSEQSSSSAVPASSPWSLFNSTTPDLSSTCSATSVAESDKSRTALTATPGSVRASNRASPVNVVASHSATPSPTNASPVSTQGASPCPRAWSPNSSPWINRILNLSTSRD